MTLGEALWHGQAHMPTTARTRLTITGGDGAYVTTDDGRRLLDGTAGLWHTNVGHGRERIARAAYDQMCRLETYHCFGRFANEPALRLADRLSALGPVPGSKVMLTSGGSDSVDLACKLALRHAQLAGDTGRTVLVSRERAYHGLHGLGTSIAGLPYNRDGYGSPSLVPDTARIPTNDLAGARAQIEEIGPERVAAIVAEPVIGTGGVHGPAEGYLEGLQALAREIGALFVADEVITGFGRTGRMFASERWGLEPDVVTLAKGLTSGYAPLGAVLVAPRVADRFFADAPDTPMFRHGLTYSGHATACAVAEANLDILTEEELVARAAACEDVLSKVLDPLRDHPLVTEVRSGSGFLAGVALRTDVDGADAAAVAADVTSDGVILRAIHENTLQICPPFVVTDDEVVHLASTIRAALDRRVAAEPGGRP